MEKLEGGFVTAATLGILDLHAAPLAVSCVPAILYETRKQVVPPWRLFVAPLLAALTALLLLFAPLVPGRRWGSLHSFREWCSA